MSYFQANNKATNHERISKDKKELRTLIDPKPTLALFLEHDLFKRDLLLEKLNFIRDFFEVQEEIEFISSSLLVAWRGNEMNVTMIDFAHVFATNEVDTNYLNAINSLINELTSLDNSDKL